MNKHLIKLDNLIKDNFYCYFKDDDVLVVCEDKESLPFAFVINDDDYKHHLLLSIAIDFVLAERSAELALWCSKVFPTAITEPFYISRGGITYTGDDAYKYFYIDMDNTLETFIPTKKELQ